MRLRQTYSDLDGRVYEGSPLGVGLTTAYWEGHIDISGVVPAWIWPQVVVAPRLEALHQLVLEAERRVREAWRVLRHGRDLWYWG